MPRRQPGNFEIWILWLVANVVPWWIGCALLFPLETLMGDIELPMLMVAWGITCALVGITQGWVLKQRLSGMKWWPVATALGGAIAFLGFFTFWGAPFVTGGTFGAAQWLILRRRVPKAWLWIVVQIVAAIAGVGAALLTPVDFMMGDFNHTIFIMGTAVEAAASAVTGTTLIFLLRQRQQARDWPQERAVK
ncbi:MAG: hypothetical protein ACFB0C_22750 [Leptolyngbyaceae cyanobacterium]